MACKKDVLERHALGWSNNRIAASLECMPEYVRATIRRNGLAPNSERSEIHRSNHYRDALSEILDAPTLIEARRIAKKAING